MILKNVNLYGNVTDITVTDGKISNIGKTGGQGTDMHGLKIYPGLIDTHIHGCLGFDSSDKEDRLAEMSRYQLMHGITTWYPTTVTVSLEDIESCVNRNTDIEDGANIPGFHMEGPFINVNCKGAQNGDFVIRADIDAFNKCNKGGKVKKISVAPECDGVLEFIEKCPILVSIGHTACDYDTASEAFKRGAKCITHTFNTMPPIHHRKPGPICAGADFDGVYAELISDGIHVHPSAVRMLVKLYGEDRVILISDSVRAAGLADGEYDLGGIDVIVKNGVARTREGNLAGSTTNLFECVKRAISFGIDEYTAVKMASENPARSMGLNKGKIEVGFDADFILVDDKFNLKYSIVGGKIYEC